MISKEMEALGKKPSVIREIFEYSNSRKAEIGAENVFDFSLGNPSIPAPEKVNLIIKKLLLEKSSVSLHGYTSAAGDITVREKIAENINRRFGFKADARLIYMSCGAAAALTSTLKAICTEGDEIAVLSPFFSEYRVFAENAGARLVPIKCKKDFSVDLQGLCAAINEKTKALIINSPNNPTGRVLSEEEIKLIAKILKQRSDEFKSPIYLISDEPYRELVYDGTKASFVPKLYDNTIVCYSYSKSLSLPGERIGYIMVSPYADGAEDIFAAICGAARSMGYVCAPSLLQYTVGECDGILPDISEYDRNRRLLYNSLKDIGYSAVEPQGAFYLFVKALEDDASEFCKRAKKHELLMVPSDTFGESGYVRISYCVAYDMIKRSLPAFKALYDEYKRG